MIRAESMLSRYGINACVQFNQLSLLKAIELNRHLVICQLSDKNPGRIHSKILTMMSSRMLDVEFFDL